MPYSWTLSGDHPTYENYEIVVLNDDMAYDICHEVRLSVLKGVRYLIENPLTHEILKVLLPRLGHMFFDGVLSVRMAVADILLAVRDLRNFQFTKVDD